MSIMLSLPVMTWLTKHCRRKPYLVGEGALSASSVARFFFDNVVRFFGVPGEIISSRDPIFTAYFGMTRVINWGLSF